MGSCRLMMAATTMSSGLHTRGATSQRQQPHSSQTACLALLSCSRALAKLATLCEQGHPRFTLHISRKEQPLQSEGAARVPEAAAAGSALVQATQHDLEQACATWGRAASIASGKRIAWHLHGPPTILHCVGAGGMSQRSHLATAQMVCILGSIQRPLQLLLCNCCCLLQQAGHRSGESSVSPEQAAYRTVQAEIRHR